MLNSNTFKGVPKMAAYVLLGLALSPLSNLMAQTASTTATSTATTTDTSLTSTTTSTTASSTTSGTTTASGTSTTGTSTSGTGSTSTTGTTSGTINVVPIYTTISTPVTIISVLSIGSRGNEVSVLQTFLARDPSIYPQGLITGYYGTLTANAVKKFQKKYGISVVGRVGPITRQKINELIISGGFGTGTGSGTVSFGTSPSIFNVSTTPMTNQDATKAMTFSWQTDRPTIGKVFYSTTPLTFSENNSPTAEPVVTGGATVVDNTFTTTKTLSVSNLNGATTYYYMIEAIDANGNVSVTWPNTSATR